MYDELNVAIEGYKKEWDILVAQQSDDVFFAGLKPTGAAWKVADLAEYDRLMLAWRDSFDQFQTKWLNGRWITCGVLREDVSLAWGITIVKLMQRRPGSDDALGLDHIDFYSPVVAAERQRLLSGATGLKITDEENGACKWLSVWFAGTEAKLRTRTTLQACIDELTEADAAIIGLSQ